MNALFWLSGMGTSTFQFEAQHAARLAIEVPNVAVTSVDCEEDFLAALPEADVAIVWRFQQAWFAHAPNLRWIATPAAGRDYFQVSPPPGIEITYGTFHGQLMGETALAMMLAGCRGIASAALRQQQALWDREPVASNMRLLRGSHVAVLGFGSIGQCIGKTAKPLGPRITGIRRSRATRPEWFDANDQMATLDQLDSLLPTVDHLVICLPRSAETNDLINARRLALLPSHAWVHNLGRGNCIDEDALASAIQNGVIMGACLDVFKEEPLPADSPLRQTPNVVIMPHISACAPEYIDSFLDEFIPMCREYMSN